MTNEERIKEIQVGREKKENLEQLWEQNRGLVCQIARKYAAFADQEELLQEGYLALHKAAYAYHPGIGARRFNETWTSATEREALRLVDRGRGQVFKKGGF